MRVNLGETSATELQRARFPDAADPQDNKSAPAAA